MSNEANLTNFTRELLGNASDHNPDTNNNGPVILVICFITLGIIGLICQSKCRRSVYVESTKALPKSTLGDSVFKKTNNSEPLLHLTEVNEPIIDRRDHK